MGVFLTSHVSYTYLLLKVVERKMMFLFYSTPESDRQNVLVPIVEMKANAQERILSVSLMKLRVVLFLLLSK